MMAGAARKSHFKRCLVLFLKSFVLFFLPSATSNPVTPKPPLFNTLLYSLVPIMGIAVIVLFSFWMYRHHKLAYPPVLVPTQVSPCCRIWGFSRAKPFLKGICLMAGLCSPPDFEVLMLALPLKQRIKLYLNSLVNYSLNIWATTSCFYSSICLRGEKLNTEGKDTVKGCWGLSCNA